MDKKTCKQCKKTYTPKSNNSKYCSRQCNNKAYHKRRTKRYQTDEEYRKHILKQKIERFKKRYHNDIAFRKNHNEKNKIFRQTEKGKQMDRNISKRCYYNNHKENKKKQAKRHRDKYQSDKQYRERYVKRNKVWRKTKAGKKAERRHKSLRRKLKYIELWQNPFPKEIKVQYHHINNILTIPIPKITHNYAPGVNKEKHITHNEKWINKIYLFDINTLKK